jgi:hypothetical protein
MIESIKAIILNPQNLTYTGDLANDEIKKKLKQQEYINTHKDTPEFREILTEISKTIISDEIYNELQQKILELPSELRCHMQNDNDIVEEFMTSTVNSIKVIRILTYKANLLTWE